MRKIVTMHQPNYLPWIGLFSKIQLADCFIISDAYQCADITRRNKIRTNTGSGYLTIPIGRKFYKSRICDVLLPDDSTWQDLHWQQIYQNYVHAQYFGDYGDFFKTLYIKNYKYLWQINIDIILLLLKCFDINVEIVKTTDLNLDPGLEGTDLILAELKSVGGHTYLSGPSGSNYLEFEKFPNNNLELKFFEFEHPVYKQRYPGFVPNLSAIDLLFNVGTMCGEIIRKSGFMKEEFRNK
jgi:hypothetical protein